MNSDKAVAYKCDLVIKDLAKQNLHTRKQNPYKHSSAKTTYIREYMSIFSAKFTNHSDTSEDPPFELACENTIEDRVSLPTRNSCS